MSCLFVLYLYLHLYQTLPSLGHYLAIFLRLQSLPLQLQSLPYGYTLKSWSCMSNTPSSVSSLCVNPFIVLSQCPWLYPYGIASAGNAPSLPWYHTALTYIIDTNFYHHSYCYLSWFWVRDRRIRIVGVAKFGNFTLGFAHSFIFFCAPTIYLWAT